MTNSLNVYPSTHDVPRIAGGQDLALAVLTKALKRYKRSGTSSDYVTETGEVCARGAIAVAAGFTRDKGAHLLVELGRSDQAFAKALVFADVEQTMANAAKEAIQLLDLAAGKLYPESVGAGWSGPLEWLNQEYGEGCETTLGSWRKAKKAVVTVYEYTIENIDGLRKGLAN